MTIHSKHTLAYCAGCQTDMVICAACGNNCCNGSYGPEPGADSSCLGCPEAYEHQRVYWSDHDSVRFTKDVR